MNKGCIWIIDFQDMRSNIIVCLCEIEHKADFADMHKLILESLVI